MENNKKNSLILVWLVILSLFYAFGWTYTLDVSTPAGTDDPREADDRMREIKGAFVERLAIDHYFTASASNIYDAIDTGKHIQVTYQAPLSAHPTTINADEAQTYTKDVSSVAELHWIDENEASIQITSGGYILGTSLLTDSVGAGAIQIANASYLKAANNAGNGEVSLIKADANDVAVVPDNSQTATNAAPTSSTGLANKKYVDDQVSAIQDPTYAGGESHTFDGGMIIKSGYVVRSGAGASVTFGTPFPNAVVSAQVVPKSAATNGVLHVVSALSTNALTILADGTNVDGYYWEVRGW